MAHAAEVRRQRTDVGRLIDLDAQQAEALAVAGLADEGIPASLRKLVGSGAFGKASTKAVSTRSRSGSRGSDSRHFDARNEMRRLPLAGRGGAVVAGAAVADRVVVSVMHVSSRRWRDRDDDGLRACQ